MLIAEALHESAETLREAGVDTPAVDAKLLFAHCFELQPSELEKKLIMGESLETDSSSYCRFMELIEQRAHRIPLQHLTGVAPFRFLELEVGQGVFIPRPETEQVVQAAVDWIMQQRVVEPVLQSPRIVDLCAGSGAIGLALASEIPEAQVWAVEISQEALVWTNKNVRNLEAIDPTIEHRYRLTLADATDATVLQELNGSIDMVISNPPYIPQRDIPQQPEVRNFDPKLALYGGSDDGLLIPERIVNRAQLLLHSGGSLIMEHDMSQAERLVAYAQLHGFSQAYDCDDWNGRPRFLFAVKD